MAKSISKCESKLNEHLILICFILVPNLTSSLTLESNSIFILLFLSLVNSGTLYLNLYFFLPTTFFPSKEEYQDTP